MTRSIRTFLFLAASAATLSAHLIGDTPTVHFGPATINPGLRTRVSFLNTSAESVLLSLALADSITGAPLALRKDVLVAPGGRFALDHLELQGPREVIGMGVWKNATTGQIVSPRDAAVSMQVLLFNQPILVLPRRSVIDPKSDSVLDPKVDGAYFGPVNLNIGQRARIALVNTSDTPVSARIALIESATGKMLGTQAATLGSNGRVALDYIEQQNLREIVAMISPRDAAATLQVMLGNVPLLVCPSEPISGRN